MKTWSRIHEWNQNVLLILIALHVVAIALYYVLRKENLLGPMISGRTLVESAPLRFAGTARALIVMSAIAVAAVAALIV